METCRENIICLELQDPTKSPSDEDTNSLLTIRNNNGREVLQLRPDEDQTTFVLRNKSAQGIFDRHQLMHTIDEAVGRLNETCTDEMQPTAAEIILQERVEADFSSFDEHFGFVNPNACMGDEPSGFELSINDKMKKVLRELKDNERVRLSWSRSMDDTDEIDNGNLEIGENVNNESMESYEEKTGSNGTVFLVRERLINDFYTHNDSDSIDPNLPSLDRNENFDTFIVTEEMTMASNEPTIDLADDCQILENPNAELFLERERQESARERLTLDLKAASLDQNQDETTKTPDTDDLLTPTTPTMPGTTSGGGRKKKRKNKNKKK